MASKILTGLDLRRAEKNDISPKLYIVWFAFNRNLFEKLKDVSQKPSPAQPNLQSLFAHFKTVLLEFYLSRGRVSNSSNLHTRKVVYLFHGHSLLHPPYYSLYIFLCHLSLVSHLIYSFISCRPALNAQFYQDGSFFFLVDCSLGLWPQRRFDLITPLNRMSSKEHHYININ